MAAGCHSGFDRTGNSAIQSADPENSNHRTKHEVDRTTRCGDMAIQNSTYHKGCIWDLHSERRGGRSLVGVMIVPLEGAMVVSYTLLIVAIVLSLTIRIEWRYFRFDQIQNGRNLSSDVSDAQFNGGGSLWVTILRCFLCSISVILGLQRNEHPTQTAKIIFKDFQPQDTSTSWTDRQLAV